MTRIRFDKFYKNKLWYIRKLLLPWFKIRNC